MAGVNDKAEIGNTGKFLEGVSIDTPAGNDLFREGVVVSDPESPDARQRVRSDEPLSDDWGAVVRVPGLLSALAALFDAIQTNALTNDELRASPVPVSIQASGTWGYRAGVDGTPTIPANAEIMQISANASTSVAASFTINGGDPVTIPLGQAVTFEPAGLLVSPTIVFTNTASYIIEFRT